MITREWLYEKVKPCGFTEMNTLLSFLAFICEETPDKSALLYIKGCVSEFLDVHDNGSQYFAALRDVKSSLSDLQE
ncbi:hypothetical protein [Erwinia billingiae]|jgi:hypothetical protein|uniref:hypothetical protein n=1 Tax=Erwinia billingiae TaxID=182337 RepID=UPI00069DD405|nr:hypothetical protein [Erwinia billingiae]MBN7121341.1 hypothetical protein [Erwinia billingiae]PRB61287.1 hypothetical protein CQ001_06010 [Erwinia billingiae]